LITVDPKGQVTDADITTAEAALPEPLPEPYRSWLKITGGGYVQDLEMPHPGGAGVLQEFLGPSELPRVYGRGFAVSVPRHYVVVGDGSGGGVAIQLSEPGRGRICWADYDKAIALYDNGQIGQDEATELIMAELATDWDAFLASR
jgi:hypothetical protein